MQGNGWWALCCLILFSLPESFSAHGDEMARSDFHWGADDWEVFGPGQLKLYEKGGVLYGSDAGRTVWYFSAPSKFLGDKSFAHSGKLAFRLGHSEYMSNGKDMIKDWDVILESKEWRLRVGVKNLIPPWVGATNNELSLNEKSWTVIKGAGHGHSPTEIQMLRLLSSLSAIYFRGGYYDGHEETWIDSIVLTEGDHHAEMMLRKVSKHHHEPLKKKKELEEQKRKEQELEMLIGAGQAPDVLQDQIQAPSVQPSETPVTPPELSESTAEVSSDRQVQEGSAQQVNTPPTSVVPEVAQKDEAQFVVPEDVARAARAAPRLVPEYTEEQNVVLPEGNTVEDVLGGNSIDPQEARRAEEEAAAEASRLAAAAAAQRKAEEEEAARARAEAEAAAARQAAEDAKAMAEEAARVRVAEEQRRAEEDAAKAREEAEARAREQAEAAQREAEAAAARAQAEAAARAEAEAAARAEAEVRAREAEEATRRIEEEAAARARADAAAAAIAQEESRASAARKMKGPAAAAAASRVQSEAGSKTASM